MPEPSLINGLPALALRSSATTPGQPAFVSATVLPGRGFMLLNAQLRLPSGRIADGVVGPDAASAAASLDGGPDDFAGNKSFAVGGAILAPYANRVRGRALAQSREIEAAVDGQFVRLPRNWGGRAPGAAQYAMHGLILNAPVAWTQPSEDRVTGRLAAGDFGGRWLSRAELEFEWRLARGALVLTVGVHNVGDAPLPVGLGWHPYFAIPSGQRGQARLRLPAARRVEVDDYDQVLPTGRLLPTAGSAFDFNAAEGRALGDLYLDDCFTDLTRADDAVAELVDPAAGLGLRIATPTPQVKAVQVYASPAEGFVAIEPQFNLADPFGEVWPPGTDTGMARLPPGEHLAYEVRVEPFAAGGEAS